MFKSNQVNWVAPASTTGSRPSEIIGFRGQMSDVPKYQFRKFESSNLPLVTSPKEFVTNNYSFERQVVDSHPGKLFTYDTDGSMSARNKQISGVYTRPSYLHVGVADPRYRWTDARAKNQQQVVIKE